MTANTQRHHFVPQFYLREWYEPGTNGFWLYYRDPKGNLRLRHRPAASVGYIDNLYSTKPDGLTFQTEVSHALELNFFAPLDMAASKVHRKLLTSGADALSDAERWAWSLFVNSLIERSPTKIQELRRNAASIPDEIIAEFRRRWPGTAARPSMQARLDNMDREALITNAALSAIALYIKEDEFLDYMTRMEWQIVDLPPRDDHFLTGDTPVVINSGGDARPIHSLSLPLSPRRLLVMYKPSLDFDAGLIGMLTLAFNVLLVRQTQQHLVSSCKLTDSQFIKYPKLVDTKFQPPTRPDK